MTTIRAKLICCFRHDWKDWIAYNHIDDIVTCTYSGKSEVMDYLPMFHHRVCGRCGKIEEHDLRVKKMDGAIGKVGFEDTYNVKRVFHE